jgi:hypothetical protein
MHSKKKTQKHKNSKNLEWNRSITKKNEEHEEHQTWTSMNQTTWAPNQTRFHEIKSTERLKIIQGSRINGLFTSSFVKSS